VKFFINFIVVGLIFFGTATAFCGGNVLPLGDGKTHEFFFSDPYIVCLDAGMVEIIDGEPLIEALKDDLGCFKEGYGKILKEGRIVGVFIYRMNYDFDKCFCTSRSTVAKMSITSGYFWPPFPKALKANFPVELVFFEKPELKIVLKPAPELLERE
jgi:hypothetical protein